MAEQMNEVTDSSFESEVIQSTIPVLVDFWAPWCGPCKAIGPVLEEVSKAYEGKIKFLKCNVDNNPKTPAGFGIRSIPTLIVFKGGKEVGKIIGLVDKTKIKDTLDKSL